MPPAGAEVCHAGHRAAQPGQAVPVRTHGGGFMWAVAGCSRVVHTAHHRPRWNQPRRARRTAPGLVCAAAAKERSNRR
jgi:hypothetical protein